MTHPPTPPGGSLSGPAPADPGPAPRPTDDELAAMSREDLMRLGAEAGEVTIVHRQERFPEPGTSAEKRAERQVALAFAIAGVAALAFVVAFIVVPWRFKVGDNSSYRWFTPALGLFMGIALLALGAGMVLWAKKLMPSEEVVQDRHEMGSDEFDKQTTAATLTQALADSGLPRRNVVKRSLGFGAGALGLLAVVLPVGGLIKKPKGELASTPWKTGVHLITVDGRRVRPADMQAGSLATVFPDVPGGLHGPDTPVMLIRLRPGTKIEYRKGQADFGWGDYVAFSKICTHLGCPVSLFEQETSRLLCPCHQSQFDILLDAKPIFGPASRPLPSLPIGLDKNGYFVARDGFVEPVGPAYWERRNDYLK